MYVLKTALNAGLDLLATTHLKTQTSGSNREPHAERKPRAQPQAVVLPSVEAAVLEAVRRWRNRDRTGPDRTPPPRVAGVAVCTRRTRVNRSRVYPTPNITIFEFVSRGLDGTKLRFTASSSLNEKVEGQS